MKESICEFCGISYTKVGGGKQRACSIACYEKHRRKDPARAAWHREYMHNYFKERGREKQPTKQICTLCGAEFYSKRNRKYCSEKCSRKFHYSKHYDKWTTYYRRKHDDIWSSPRTCIVCGKQFNKQYGHVSNVCCSEACSIQNEKDSAYNAKKRREARIKEQIVHRIYRKKVYERDHWKCQICGKKVRRSATVPDPLAPTLDHIIPICEGGEHSYRNVRTAHFICNSLRGSNATPQGDQVMLFG